ncbi:DUF4160 domain-containing protein [Lewinella sp. 4G2]|uniref:DUF4160 domain-containing protein n=1 Tax=Lewinella sp. 4G2 TaxID=1803372 RepID=UPI0007DEFF5E|nr:DUF4160 domain-containing protein [Lewinella sp. 4G2]OAV45066.1 hypothetical protein A3850_011460 [Lewinella sp. 4G2]
MPTVHTIGSIKIKLYYKDHLPPHFHAQYNEFEILIEIRSLEKYAGDLPKKQLKAVLEWAAENQEALMERWDKYFNEN